MISLCSMPDCDKAPRDNQRYCPACHSKYMKAWRAKKKREQAHLLASVLRLSSKIVEQNKTIAELKVG